GETGEGDILWRVDDAFGQVMSPKQHGCVPGLVFGPTPSGNHLRILEECTLPSLVNATKQKIKEMEIQIASLEDKLISYDSLKAEMCLMKFFFSQMNPLLTFNQDGDDDDADDHTPKAMNSLSKNLH
ncbi:hypothetical protein SO802_035187, partial [Lithocarpus litseifolius]